MSRPPSAASGDADMEREFPDLYRRLVLSISDHAIFAVDRTGQVMSWNAGAERIQGYTSAEAIGQPVSLFYCPEDVAAGEPERLLREAESAGRAEEQGWRVRKNGERFRASVAVSTLTSDEGELIGFTKIIRDIAEPHSTTTALQESEERFRLLVQSVKDYAILMLDTEGRVVSWNEGAERIKGYTAAQIMGHSFAEFYTSEARAVGFPQYELEVAARDGRFEDEGWRVRRDGSRFWANVVITALRDADGALLGYAKVTRDLTARREAEEAKTRLAEEEAAHAEAARRSIELAQLNDQLQEQSTELEEQAVELEQQTMELQSMMERIEASNEELQAALATSQLARATAERAAEAVAAAYRELDQFAYVTSHDLKAPLRGIANLAQWIQEDVGEALPIESREHMALLQGRVRRMEALIDGILAYSRAGRTRGAVHQVDSGALVAEVVEFLAVAGDVRIEVQPAMPLVLAERVPFQQLFMNLISNAVKYGTAYRPDVVVRVGWSDVGDAHEFTVSDNGPGIAPEYHDRIWAIFQTLDARDRVEGTGIGLSVVKKIVEFRGGRVWVRSAPDEGSTFGFIWPKDIPTESVRWPRPCSTSSSSRTTRWTS